MEDLTLEKLKSLVPIWSSKEKKPRRKPRRKKKQKYLVYHEDRAALPEEPRRLSRGVRLGPRLEAERAPGNIRPSNKSDELNDKKKKLSFEKFKSDVDKHDRAFESGSEFLESLRGRGRRKEVPMFMNMYDPFRNNLGIIQDYLRHQRDAPESGGERLETIQEKHSSVASSKSGLTSVCVAETEYQHQHLQQHRGAPAAGGLSARRKAVRGRAGAPRPGALALVGQGEVTRTRSCASWWWASGRRGRLRSSKPSSATWADQKFTFRKKMKGHHYDLYRASMQLEKQTFTIEFIDLKGFARGEQKWGQRIKKAG